MASEIEDTLKNLIKVNVKVLEKKSDNKKDGVDIVQQYIDKFKKSTVLER